MSFELIRGDQYLGLLRQIKEVCSQSGKNFEIKNSEQIDYLINNEDFAKHFNSSLKTIENTAACVNKLFQNNLVCFEAANRVGLNKLAARFLEDWILEAKEIFKDANPVDPKFTIESIASLRLFQMPIFQNKVLAEEQIMKGLKDFKNFGLIEIVHLNLHQGEEQTSVPSALKPLMYKEQAFLDAFDRYLIQKYSQFQNSAQPMDYAFDNPETHESQKRTALEFGSSSAKRQVTDSFAMSDVSASLPHVQVVFGTPVEFEWVGAAASAAAPESPVHSFQWVNPNLSSASESMKKNVNLSTIDFKDFSDVQKQLSKASDITYPKGFSEKLVKEFQKKPSVELFQGLIYLISKVKEFKTKNEIFDFTYDLYECFAEFLKSPQADWSTTFLPERPHPFVHGSTLPPGQNADSIAATIIDQFIEILDNTLVEKEINPHLDDRLPSVIKRYFEETLKITHTQRDNTKKVVEYSKLNADRLRTILKMYRGHKSFNGHAISNEIKWCLNQLKDTFFETSNVDIANNYKFLTEMLVEVSYQFEIPSAAHFETLPNPHKKTTDTVANVLADKNPLVQEIFKSVGNIVVPTAKQPGPYVAKLAPYSIASAFAMKLPVEKRETLLRIILANYKGHPPLSEYYPLSKIVCGAMTLEDYPENDRQKLIADRLGFEPTSTRSSASNYRGVFEENISYALKQAYFKALSEGELGGKNKALVDALVALYKRSSTSSDYKTVILASLQKFQTSSSELNAYAANKLSHLRVMYS